MKDKKYILKKRGVRLYFIRKNMIAMTESWTDDPKRAKKFKSLDDAREYAKSLFNRPIVKRYNF